MPERVLGRKPGELCNICGTGRLVAQFQAQHRCNTRIGGPPGPSPTLHHLVCSGCGLWYASAVGGNLNDLLGVQANETFKNPATQPEQCHQCKEPVSSYTVSTGFVAYRGSEDDLHALRLLYCHSCILLLWKFPSRAEQLFEKLPSLEPALKELKTPR